VQPGVYLRLGLEPRAASAVICVDNDCKTIPVQRVSDLGGSDQKYAVRIDEPVTWTPGTTVALTIDVLDAKGVSLAKIAEHRKMGSLGLGACSPCPAFTYDLDNQVLSRVA
jgi:hypothetical protein